jgi:hypothetical protein
VIEQAQGDLWSGVLVDFLWHLRLLASLGILGPGLGQKQLGADGQMKRGAAGRIVGQILRTHDHLAIANFANNSSGNDLHLHETHAFALSKKPNWEQLYFVSTIVQEE